MQSQQVKHGQMGHLDWKQNSDFAEYLLQMSGMWTDGCGSGVQDY